MIQQVALLIREMVQAAMATEAVARKKQVLQPCSGPDIFDSTPHWHKQSFDYFC